MGRAPCCDKANVKRGTWSPEEDAKLKSYIDRHGTGGNWITLPQKIGLNRCGKSCRLRWLNYLRPNIKHGRFSEEEDNVICSLYISIGSRWSIIAAQLPGRTDNDIKNYWNTRLKKKLLGKEKQARRGRERGARVKQNAGLHTQTQIPVQNEEPRFDDHAPARKPLIRFCHGNRIDGENLKLQYPVMDEPLIQPPVYNYSMDLVSVSAQLIFSFNPSSSLPDGADLSSMFPGASHGFSDETTERLMYENPHERQGLGFFDNDFVNGSSVGKAVTCGENMDWEQMVFSASGLNYNEGFLQGSQMCVPGGLSCRL